MPQEDSLHSPAASAQVTVSRNSDEDVQTRQIMVSLDGELKSELLFGDNTTFSAAPGHHVLRVDNTWNHKDVELELVAGSHLYFIAKSSAGQFSRFLLVAFGAGPIYVSIEPATPPQ
jgi:hypothetical protein